MADRYAIALSEKQGEQGIKDLSLRIKTFFPKHIRFLFTFFTPGFNAHTVLKTINFTLHPEAMVGIQSPALIYEDRIIPRGIAAFCVNSETVQRREQIITSDEPQRVETSLRELTRATPAVGEKRPLLAFLPSQFSPRSYLRGAELALGRFSPLYGAGYVSTLLTKHCKCMGGSYQEGIQHLFFRGQEIVPHTIQGFFPLGKPFTVTRTIQEKNVIIEINGEPAEKLYEHYLEEKFEAFKQHRLFKLYPLGINAHGATKLLHVADILDDGSLVCVGNVASRCRGHLMFLDPSTDFEIIPGALSPIKKHGGGVLFVVNSLLRKRILKDHAHEEIKTIKNALGPAFRMIGFYSDYALFPDTQAQRIDWNVGNIFSMLWK
ncbi:MAG: hypothetical protein GF333_01915 [Candidatus Omnitrophica bacterium]|nr:hypothetical protein [Candidatus Omnitrophota bacterium]